MTEIGCANVPNAQVLTEAATVQIVASRLTVRSATGAVLGVYLRVG